MANARGKAVDNTHLSIDQAEARGFIHRDYIAHCLRWTHVAKHIQRKQRYKNARVLDIGCGVDLPLARLFYSSRLIVKEYVGVDYNNPGKFKTDMFHTGKMPVSAYGNVDAGTDIEVDFDDDQSGVIIGEDKFAPFNVVTCFEVLEHVEPGHCRQIAQKILQVLDLWGVSGEEKAVAFLSTPCWDPVVGAAANHVSEIRYEAFGAMLEDLGFAIDDVFGTFASMRDYKQTFFDDYADGEDIWNRLSEYYDVNYLATILAPLYPDRSRNALWKVSVATENYQRRFKPLSEMTGGGTETPWTSSSKWEELNG